MLAAGIISKKRDSKELTRAEIEFIIRGLVDGTVPDYQVAAWAMAVLCRGMNRSEIVALTDLMLHSGNRLQVTSDRPRVDKHSTGGLGDKVSLILAPLLACFDVDVPMLSGRGLGITGGTLDKLEAYPGFRCDLSEQEIASQLESIQCVITGTTPDITPADRKLYRLRDVTGTVPSVALITASILSKKLSESLDALVLDVKFGSGAFMKTEKEARELSDSLVQTSREMGLATRSVLSDMNQPLGLMVGNACEANEAVLIMRGEGPQDTRELTIRLGAELLEACGRFDSIEQASAALSAAIDDGRALERYVQMIEAQGGKFYEQLPVAAARTVVAERDGWIESLDGELLGMAVVELGGGRRKLDDQLDHSVGIEMLTRVGDQIQRGQPLLNVLASDDASFELAATAIHSAIAISDSPVEPLQLVQA